MHRVMYIRCMDASECICAHMDAADTHGGTWAHVEAHMDAHGYTCMWIHVDAHGKIWIRMVTH